MKIRTFILFVTLTILSISGISYPIIETIIEVETKKHRLEKQLEIVKKVNINIVKQCEDAFYMRFPPKTELYNEDITPYPYITRSSANEITNPSIYYWLNTKTFSCFWKLGKVDYLNIDTNEWQTVHSDVTIPIIISIPKESDLIGEAEIKNAYTLKSLHPAEQRGQIKPPINIKDIHCSKLINK